MLKFRRRIELVGWDVQAFICMISRAIRACKLLGMRRLQKSTIRYVIDRFAAFDLPFRDSARKGICAHKNIDMPLNCAYNLTYGN